MPHQYPAVEMPGTAFHLMATAVRVPTVAAIAALIPTWEEGEPTLGPFAEQDPETEVCKVVRPRNVQVVPRRYAAKLVHCHQIHPKHAYMELVVEAQARGELEACQDMITWLRAACTARGGGGAQVPSVHQVITPLHLPPDVYR